jgi:hypothetical protein
MSAYEPIIINGKTVFVPVQQQPQPVPPQAAQRVKAPHAKRIGKKYCERKNWW